jgi:Domain of Unknown Function (DUF326)
MSTNKLQDSKYQSCIDACNACAESCEFCATSCLREQDVKMLERCIQLNRECACICYSASQIMSMDGEHVKEICRVCADICDACAEECEKHKQMDHCQQCAQACRTCAGECRKMAR